MSQGLLQSTASRCHGSSCSLVEMHFKDECRSVEALLYFIQGQNYYHVSVWLSLCSALLHSCGAPHVCAHITRVVQIFWASAQSDHASDAKEDRDFSETHCMTFSLLLYQIHYFQHVPIAAWFDALVNPSKSFYLVSCRLTPDCLPRTPPAPLWMRQSWLD